MSKNRSKTRKRVSKRSPEKLFDKFDLYRRAVQSPDTDVEFIRNCYRELRKKEPRLMREDFCGTFALSCAWIKQGSRFEAIGVDFDPEPLEYGRLHHLKKMPDSEQRRIHLMEADVLKTAHAPTDIALAFNFSYFTFRTRNEMKLYFSNVHKSLKQEGLFLVDCFGGSLCHDANEEKSAHGKFTYFWDQESFDPVTNRAKFHIHFSIKGLGKKERVFSYDWRMWSIPELREIMAEAGFSKTHVYWEGTTKSGEGDGVFTRTEKGEACQSWIAYIVGEK